MVIDAPVSTIPSIIGSKGANLNLIREQTGVRVDIPRRDATQANGTAHSGAATPLPDAGDEDEEPTIPVTITGPQPLAQQARDMIQETISLRTWSSTRRVKDIPEHILPFVVPHRPKFIQAADGADITLQLDQVAREITVSGDRAAVARVVDTIKSAIEYYKAEVTSYTTTLPKRQHRLLLGKGADEVMAKSRCAVIIQSLDEPGDEITVWGREADLGDGVTALMDQANSVYIHEFPLPGPIAVSRQLITYMSRINYPQTLNDKHPGVSVYIPPQGIIAKAQVLSVDIIGDKPNVDVVVKEVSQLVGKLTAATKDVSIDWLIHSIVNSHKNAKKYVYF